MRLKAKLVALLLGLCSPSAMGHLYVIASPEYTATVKIEEAQAYYQAIVDQLSSHKDVTLVENTQLKLVFDAQDLSAAMSSESANQAYLNAGKNVQANEVLVASLCKVGEDFILSLRMISIKNGSTKVCATRRTRVVAKFKDQAALQVEQLLSDSSGQGGLPTDQDVLAIKDVRQTCRDAKADRFFPTLWRRAEKLREALKDDQDPSGVVAYYVSMLHLAARSANPPAGMVFIPGGYVTMGTSAGKRQLWVEPFFMDRCEVSAADYAQFLGAKIPGGSGSGNLAGFKPLKSNNQGPDAMKYPVVGVSWNGAQAYAKWRGRQLPTVLQWMHAAYGDDREYPCGDAADCAGANLKGDDDGYAGLAPADKPGADESPFGILGMTGNVREWTATWQEKDLYAKCDPDAPEEPADGKMKLVKGGSFRTGLERASQKAGVDPCKCGETADDISFRCVLPFFLSMEDAEKKLQDSNEP